MGGIVSRGKSCTLQTIKRNDTLPFCGVSAAGGLKPDTQRSSILWAIEIFLCDLQTRYKKMYIDTVEYNRTLFEVHIKTLC
jgi:hypothetical protein